MAKNRLTRIVTKTGDKGITSLADGERIEKVSPIIEAIGAVDELNAALGVLRSFSKNEVLKTKIISLQQRLFDIGGELSLPESFRLDEKYVSALEDEIKVWNKTLPPLKEFILPGGDPASASCHVARTVCRRVERRLLTAKQMTKINPNTLTFINRLSDYLFVLARVMAKDNDADTLFWKNKSNS